LVLGNELCAFVQIIKVSARQLLAPSRTRPRSRLTQVCSRSGGQDVARPPHRASILVLEIANRLGRKPAVLQVIEAFQNIQGDPSVLHILADQIADVLARRRIDILIARPLIDVLAKRVSQLDIEAATQGVALKEGLQLFCAQWQ
jgi:hypothetical protein